MDGATLTHRRGLARSRSEQGSLVDLLRSRAKSQADHKLYTFLPDGPEPERSLTYAELDQQARSIGAWLQSEGAPGQRALLLFPPGLDYIAAFFGCLYAKAVAVPAYPPRQNRNVDRLRAIVNDAPPALVLTTQAIMSQIGSRLNETPDLNALRWKPIDSIERQWAEQWRQPSVDVNTLAFLQYTSGSTANPKGVMISHGNLLHNERMIQRAFGQTEQSVIVGWLPLFHDMGLIGNVLQPLYIGAQCVLLSPITFLQRPFKWLETISRYRGTTSGGPNFAYDLCSQKISPEQAETLDLSSWTIAFNGSEPVRMETLDRFCAAFEPCGFRREAFYPCYGLAEATLFVSGGQKNSRPRIRAFRRTELEQNRVAPASPGGPDARNLVSCGDAWLKQQIRIVDPESGALCPWDRVGEIWVSGESIAQGYWDRPEESGHTFQAYLEDTREGPYLRTGDLGFIEDGQLYITGRLKDLIIVRGRNYYPQDIEHTVGQCDPALRPGECAAFSLDIDGDERLIIVHEIVRGYRGDNLAGVVENIRKAVAEEHDLQLYAVCLIKPGRLLKTSSGKIQRHAMKAAFQNGSLEPLLQWRLAGPIEVEEAGGAIAAPGNLEDITEWIASKVASRLGLSRSEITLDQSIVRYGLDSLSGIDLVHSIEAATGASLPVTAFLHDVSVSEIASQVLAQLDRPAVSSGASLAQAQRQKAYPLSHGQAALWFLYRLAPHNAAYNVVGAARIPGDVSVAALRIAFQTLIERHPSLRVRFDSRGGDPVQIIQDDVEVSFHLEDVSGGAEARLSRRVMEEARRPFDLENGPVFRVILFSLDDGGHLLLLAAHHIVIDLWSLAVMVKELGAIYEAETSGTGANLPALEVGYEDYVRWQEQALAGARGLQLQEYWRRQMSGELPVLNLITDCPRPPVQTYEGASEAIKLGGETTDRLQALACRNGTTLYTVLLAAYQSLLYRHTGQEELLVGSPTSGRTDGRFQSLVGYFVNPVVIRARPSGDLTFQQFLAEARETVLAAFEHQEYPFALLVKQTRAGRDPSRSPVFQTTFVFEKAPAFSDQSLAAFVLGEEGARLRLGSLTLESIKLDQEIAQFDLSMVVAQFEDGLTVSLQYNKNLFKAATVKRMLGHFQTLVDEVIAEPDWRISEIPILTGAERRQLLAEFNDTREEYRSTGYLHQLFEEQVEKTPHAIGLIYEGGSLTYRELNTRANRLARRLRRLGVASDAPVAILLERSPEMIISMLAVLKAGGAYLPLDQTYPTERLSFMVEDTRASALICRQGPADRLPRHTAKVVDLNSQADLIERESGENLLDCPETKNLAYVIYTSGSTGQPKGVAIDHSCAINFIHWGYHTFSPEDLSGVFASTSICFDLSIFEIFVPLSIGGAVILADDALHLATHAASAQVTLINTVPSAMGELLRLKAVGAGVRTVNLAGEALKNSLAQQVYAETSVGRVLNLYGPTEYTTYTTGQEVEYGSQRQPTIGRPVANTQVYILDEAMDVAPIGVAGEIYIGGRGLARCYFNRPEMTADRFIPDNLGVETGARLYRTGDLGLYLENGEIEYLGRKDHQVKIRGYRIELGEIELALLSCPGIKAAVVVAREDHLGEKQIVAYIVTGRVTEQDQPIASGELRDYLKRTLPNYMAPQAFVTLEALPLTRNGKVDRRALPAPSANGYAPARELVKPRNPIEEMVAGVWIEVLGLEQISVTDNFFVLGGHSLKAVQVVSRLSDLLRVELPVRALFEEPTVECLASVLNQAVMSERGVTRPPIERVLRDGRLPLSFAQQRLWFLHRLEPNSAAYNISFSARFTGRLNVPALEQSANEIVRRHETLRATFPQAEGEPTQVIVPHLALALPIVDLRDIPEAEREESIRRLAAEEARRTFDLEHGPLLRMSLLWLGEEECALSMSMHHIISDGWSLGVFVRELTAHYEAFSAATPSPLPPLTIQYADFAAWQRRRLKEDAVQPLLSYWKSRLNGAPAMLELPADRPRPPVRSQRGAALRFALRGELIAGLEALGRREGATLFMTLLSGYQLLLSRYSGQTDISVGAPVANRNRPEVEPLIGYFINTLVMRSDLSGDPTFRELLGRVREVALGAYAHEEVPFERLVSELHAERDLSRTPLFQVVMVLQNAPLGSLALGGTRLEPEEIDNGAAKFDMTAQLTETEDGVVGRWEYSADLFDAATIERMETHFRTLLESIVENPQRRISELPLLTPTERRHLLAEWSGATEEHIEPRGLHELFERQAEYAPDAVALVYEGEYVSYGELNGRANQLAHYLLEMGVGPEACVAILLERSIEMVVAMLGALKSGAAYAPLDPAYPQDRIVYALEDCAAAVALTQTKLAEKLLASPAIRSISVDDESGEIGKRSRENPRSRAAGENLAYVIYTSGSSGQPKGALVTHHNVTRLFRATHHWFNFNRQDVWTLFHSFAFDFSVWEMWGALLYGGRLIIVPYWISRSPESFYDLLLCERVTTLNQTPSAFYQLSQYEELSVKSDPKLCLRFVIFGGEALEFQSLRPWIERRGDEQPRLINMYGITETTVHVTYRPICSDDALSGAGSLIGRRIGDLRLYVLDERMEPAPPGVGGELYVGGAGVARGYLNRGELTAERFVPDPFSASSGARLYRTGDLGRRLAHGDIEYLGRRDQQVKIQGFRIELGEIEAILASYPGVRAAAVVAREDEPGRKYLAGYLTGDGVASVTDLRAYLQSKLPSYMVPTTFTWLEQFHLTPNGKIDRKALPEPEREGGSQRYVAPRTPVEKVLAAIWAQVLQVERVGVNDNFFDLGGDSILSIHIIASARRAGLNLTPQQLFQQQTLAELALVAEEIATNQVDPTTPRSPLAGGLGAESSGYKPSDFPRVNLSQAEIDILVEGTETVELDDIYPLTPLQQGMLFHILDTPGSGIYLNQQRYTLQGELDVPAFKSAFQKVIDRHQILRTAFFLSSLGEPFQVVYRRLRLPWEQHDLRDLSEAEKLQAVEALIQTDRELGFELFRPPLMRMTLVRLEANLYQFIWSFHLMLLDGWSVPLILKDLIAYYDGLRRDQVVELEQPIRYGDYIDWLQKQSRDQAEAYWRQSLAGFNRSTSLGDDRLSPAIPDERAEYGEKTILLEEAETSALRSFAGRRKLTLNTLIQGAWALLLSRRSGADDVIFGSVVSGRPVDFPGIGSAVGMFLNTLPARIRVVPDSRLLPWLEALQTQQTEARRFEFCSLVDIQGWSEVPRGQPLFESVLIFQNIPINVSLSESEGLRLVDMRSTEKTNYPLTVIVYPAPRLLIKIVYNRSRFDDATIGRMMERLHRALIEMTAAPEASLSSLLSTRAEAERRLLINSFNQTLENF